uniref:Putative secreted protein n=1 Tax=Anopheles marajoara TaxID=58244 RepID=A0A2M4C6U0_9DIPT
MCLLFATACCQVVRACACVCYWCAKSITKVGISWFDYHCFVRDRNPVVLPRCWSPHVCTDGCCVVTRSLVVIDPPLPVLRSRPKCQLKGARAKGCCRATRRGNYADSSTEGGRNVELLLIRERCGEGLERGRERERL